MDCSPLLRFRGGTPPTAPARGLRPLDPRFPTPVGFGFAGVLGPTRGRVYRGGLLAPFKVSWGDTPHSPLPGGLRPPGPPFPHPRWLRVYQRSGSHSWAGLLRWATRPLFWFRGGTPPTAPARGLRPLDPRFPTPVGRGFASVLGLTSPAVLSRVKRGELRQIFPLPSQGRGPGG